MKEFGGGNKKTMKVAELKKIEHGSRIIEKFLQEFRRVAREGRYEERLLIEEFKRGMNEMIRRKLIKTEKLPRSIKQVVLEGSKFGQVLEEK